MRTHGICWALGAFLFTAAAALPVQLPPEIELDRRLLAAREAVAAGEWIEAHNSLIAAEKLKDEQSLELPPEFWFLRARVFFFAAAYDEAIEATTQYLTLTGRGGESYAEALRLLNEAEKEKATTEHARQEFEETRKRIEAVLARMEFVPIPAGEYQMGTEGHVWQVRISREFQMGKYEVTQEEWEAVMGSNPSGFSGCGRCPVERVSWHDVQAFIGELNAATDGVRYRLPTEAEWEFAARAGKGPGAYAADLSPIAWYDDNSGGRTHTVGQKAPNAWGLHDMVGNVEEWVHDWFAWPDDRPRGPLTDPRGPLSGDGRIIRGCGWDDHYERCEVPINRTGTPEWRYHAVGFRLVRSAP